MRTADYIQLVAHGGILVSAWATAAFGIPGQGTIDSLFNHLIAISANAAIYAIRSLVDRG